LIIPGIVPIHVSDTAISLHTFFNESVCSNPTHGDMYSVQHNVIEFVRQVLFSG